MELAHYAVFLAFIFVPVRGQDVGYIWQVTDFHLDTNYSTQGDRSQMCHLSGTLNLTRLGSFGDFSCDSPWLLVNSAIEAMYNYRATPDFIIWTGDVAPHVSVDMLSADIVISLLRNISAVLRDVFPKTPVYPSFGNHDAYPSGQMPGANTSYYERVLNASGWQDFLPPGSSETFNTGGYYSCAVSSKLRLLSLNTAMYYMKDQATAPLKDPGQQLQWLEMQLQSARSNNTKVYISAHISPGILETVLNYNFMQAAFNQRYTDILLRYSDVIAGQFYGHAHTDSFRLISNSTGYVTGAAFLSPSVTPYGVGSVPGRNPGIRLYSYDRSTLKVLDYTQYYLNLTAANANASATWKAEYSFRATYNVSDAGAESLSKVYSSFSDSRSPAFASYLLYNNVGKDTGSQCGNACISGHMCALRYVNFTEYGDCLNRFNRTTTAQPAPTGTGTASIAATFWTVIIPLTTFAAPSLFWMVRSSYLCAA